LSAPEGKAEYYTGYVVKLLLLVVLGVFVYGLGQKYFSWPIIITQNQEYAKGIALRYAYGGHMISTFAGHYDMASFMVMALPVLVSFYFVVKKKEAKKVFLFSSLSALWLLSNSLSRISVVSYLISITVTLLLVKRAKMVPIVLFISLVIFGFSSSLLDRYIRVIEVVKNRVGVVRVEEVYAAEESGFPVRMEPEKVVTPAPVPIFEDRSASIRINVEWPRAIRALKKNPLLGTGYSSITLATDNDFLRLLGETGIIGFFSFILIFLELLREFVSKVNFRMVPKKPSDVFMFSFLGSIVGVFGNALFIDVFEASKFATIFWLLIGLCIYNLRDGNLINEKAN